MLMSLGSKFMNNMHYDPRAQVVLFEVIILSKQQSNPKGFQFINIDDYWNQYILVFEMLQPVINFLLTNESVDQLISTSNFFQ